MFVPLANACKTSYSEAKILLYTKEEVDRIYR